MMMMMMKQLNMFPWFYLYVTVCLHYLLGCCLPVRPYSLDVGNSAGQTRSGGEIRWSMIPLNSPRYGLYVTQRNTHKREKNMDLWPEKGKSCKRDKVLLWHLCWCCNMTQQKFAKGPGLWFLYQVHCSSKYKAFNQLGEKKKNFVDVDGHQFHTEVATILSPHINRSTARIIGRSWVKILPWGS